MVKPSEVEKQNKKSSIVHKKKKKKLQTHILSYSFCW